MILSEPPPTQADLHFRVAGFPVRVHPFFWAIALLLGLSARKGEPLATLMWMMVMFVSIVVHELGHTFLQRKFGGQPRIVLHGFGGLAICDDCDRSPRSHVLICLAGPVAGFLLAALVVIFVALTSREMTLLPIWSDAPQPKLAGWAYLGFGELFFTGYRAVWLNDLVNYLLQINIMWGLLNLLPIYPLDGGQIARELMTLGASVTDGIVNSLKLSIGAAGAMAVIGLLVWRTPFVVIMFGLLAYMNYRNLQAYTGRGPGMGWR